MIFKVVNYDIGTEYSPGKFSSTYFDEELIRVDMPAIKNQLHCNSVKIYGKLRNNKFIRQQALEAKRIIPPNSRILPGKLELMEIDSRIDLYLVKSGTVFKKK